MRKIYIFSRLYLAVIGASAAFGETQLPMIIHTAHQNIWVVARVKEEKAGWKLKSPSLPTTLPVLLSKANPMEPKIIKLSMPAGTPPDPVQIEPICLSGKCSNQILPKEIESIEVRALPKEMIAFYSHAALKRSRLGITEPIVYFSMAGVDDDTGGAADPHPQLTLDDFSSLLGTLTATLFYSSSFEAMRPDYEYLEGEMALPPDLQSHFDKVMAAALCEKIKDPKAKGVCFKKIYPNIEMVPNLSFAAHEVAKEEFDKILLPFHVRFEGSETYPGDTGPQPQLYPALDGPVKAYFKERQAWIKKDAERRYQLHLARLKELRTKLLNPTRVGAEETLRILKGASPTLNHQDEWGLKNERETKPKFPPAWFEQPLITSLLNYHPDITILLFLLYPYDMRADLTQFFKERSHQNQSSLLEKLSIAIKNASQWEVAKARLLLKSKEPPLLSPVTVLHSIAPQDGSNIASKAMRAKVWIWNFSKYSAGSGVDDFEKRANESIMNQIGSVCDPRSSTFNSIHVPILNRSAELQQVDVEYRCN